MNHFIQLNMGFFRIKNWYLNINFIQILFYYKTLRLDKQNALLEKK
jgi:hypothetical protein